MYFCDLKAPINCHSDMLFLLYCYYRVSWYMLHSIGGFSESHHYLSLRGTEVLGI